MDFQTPAVPDGGVSKGARISGRRDQRHYRMDATVVEQPCHMRSAAHVLCPAGGVETQVLAQACAQFVAIDDAGGLLTAAQRCTQGLGQGGFSGTG